MLKPSPKSWIKTIGTSTSMQSSNLLLYPSISVCSIDDSLMRYVSDGKCFESVQAYMTFLETNVTTSYALESGPPNITEILQSIDTFDVNGTMHVMSPINNDRQNRDRTWSKWHYFS